MHSKGRAFYFILILFLSPYVFASSSNFCSQSSQDLLRKLESDVSSRVSFPNTGGLLNGGTCWWHSRLQRSIIHLAYFSPEKPRPTLAHAKKIIRKLVLMDKVVEIPGYSDFHSFSNDYQKEIQRKLNAWQVRDGFLNQKWVNGLYGKTKMSASKLKARMDSIFKEFSAENKMFFFIVQLKGITAHSLLLSNMLPIQNGYRLHVVDSNEPLETYFVDYQFGDETLYHHEIGDDFILYKDFSKELQKLKKARATFCTKKSLRRALSKY